MRTTILPYVIAVLGLVMIVGGVYSFFVLWNEKGNTETLRDAGWNDLWRLCYGRHSADLASTGCDCARDTAALKFVVAHDKARVHFLDSPRRREAALRCNKRDSQ